MGEGEEPTPAVGPEMPPAAGEEAPAPSPSPAKSPDVDEETSETAGPAAADAAATGDGEKKEKKKKEKKEKEPKPEKFGMNCKNKDKMMCPLKHEELNWIWIGDMEDARNCDQLKKHNVRYVLNCTPTRNNGGVANFHEKDPYFSYCRIAMGDNSTEQLKTRYETAWDFFEKARVREDGGILVHCQQGVSRSCSMVICYLMKYYRFTFDDALKLCRISRKQAHPNEGFTAQLMELDEDLRRTNSYEKVPPKRKRIGDGADGAGPAKKANVGPARGPAGPARGPAPGPARGPVGPSVGPAVGPQKGPAVGPARPAVGPAGPPPGPSVGPSGPPKEKKEKKDKTPKGPQGPERPKAVDLTS